MLRFTRLTVYAQLRTDTHWRELRWRRSPRLSCKALESRRRAGDELTKGGTNLGTMVRRENEVRLYA